MPSLEQLYQEIIKLGDRLTDAITLAKLSPKQITIIQGLSEVSKNLGTITAGEFLALVTGEDPQDTNATGTFISAEGRIFGTKMYHIGGVFNGDLKWGANAITGELEAGDGAALLTTLGVSVYDGVTEVARLGNLNGFLDYVTDTYGFAIGNTDGWMAYESDNGLRIYGGFLNQREILMADRTYYVSTAGEDTNSGITVDTPFLTIQHAIDTITDELDIRNYNVTIQLIEGADPAIGFAVVDDIQLLSAVGNGSITILGDPDNPFSIPISGSTTCNNIFNCSQNNTKYIINGVKITNSTTGGNGIYVERGYVELKNIEFSTVEGNHLESTLGGEIKISSGYTISGGATKHLYSHLGSKIEITANSAITITLTGDPAFTHFAYANILGIISFTNSSNVTISGTATGIIYYANANSVIWTETLTLPGDTAGSVENGGYYY